MSPRLTVEPDVVSARLTVEPDVMSARLGVDADFFGQLFLAEPVDDRLTTRRSSRPRRRLEADARVTTVGGAGSRTPMMTTRDDIHVCDPDISTHTQALKVGEPFT